MNKLTSKKMAATAPETKGPSSATTDGTPANETKQVATPSASENAPRPPGEHTETEKTTSEPAAQTTPKGGEQALAPVQTQSGATSSVESSKPPQSLGNTEDVPSEALYFERVNLEFEQQDEILATASKMSLLAHIVLGAIVWKVQVDYPGRLEEWIKTKGEKFCRRTAYSHLTFVDEICVYAGVPVASLFLKETGKLRALNSTALEAVVSKFPEGCKMADVVRILQADQLLNSITVPPANPGLLPESSGGAGKENPAPTPPENSVPDTSAESPLSTASKTAVKCFDHLNKIKKNYAKLEPQEQAQLVGVLQVLLQDFLRG
jgi:hypothetical protein